MSKNGLENACEYLAERVLNGKGAISSDVVETLGQSFLSICEEHQDHVRRNREGDDVIENAVRYLADVHAIPPMGTGTAWFSNSMNVLIELAVPNGTLDSHAAKVLPQIQEGIMQSLVEAQISKAAVRLDDKDAKDVKLFEVAGTQFGLVSGLLDLVEMLYHGDPLDEDSNRLFLVAATAAPMTRRARIVAGLDKE